MKGPIDKKQKYSGGKALRRIRYFETQRGLFQSSAEEDTGLPALARHPLPIAYYAKAHEAKQRLISQASGRAHLPLWLSLGPSSIPHGQTYGIGGNNAPAVSGRCVGIMISPNDTKHLVLCSAGGGLWKTLD